MIYWIGNVNTGQLGIIPRPQGGEKLKDEINALSMKEIDVVVSLLEPVEIETCQLKEEGNFCSEKGIHHFSFPIPDKGIPYSRKELSTFIKELSSFLERDRKVVIHCRQSIGRSAMVAASMLVMQGINADLAFEEIEAAGKKRVPDTQEQINWVKAFKRYTELF